MFNLEQLEELERKVFAKQHNIVGKKRSPASSLQLKLTENQVRAGTSQAWLHLRTVTTLSKALSRGCEEFMGLLCQADRGYRP